MSINVGQLEGWSNNKIHVINDAVEKIMGSVSTDHSFSDLYYYSLIFLFLFLFLCWRLF